MDEDQEEFGYSAPEATPRPPRHLVTLSPFTPRESPHSRRRLSSQFVKPSRPIRTAARGLAWVSLQGRLIGAEEATSAQKIGCGRRLKPDEAVAWDLFSPIHRVLIVAVVAVAVAKSKKDRQICQLRKCVQLRDDILLSMQEKLDNLCEQINTAKEEPEAETQADISLGQFMSNESWPASKPEFIDSNCWLCDQHQAQSNESWGHSLTKDVGGDEMCRRRLSLSSAVEQEERRMSDLSDWASSVTSAADVQLNSLAIEQDIYNLKRECEEKDVAIKELSTFIRSKDASSLKRIQELEDVIRHKNMLITKLKKDMMFLEQKVVQLTRLRRNSFSGSTTETKQPPFMNDNLLFDMDSTSPSSSDSDSSGKRKKNSTTKAMDFPPPHRETPAQTKLSDIDVASKGNHKSAPARCPSSLAKSLEPQRRSIPASPLTEKSMNQKSDATFFLRPRQLSAGGDARKSKRRAEAGTKDSTKNKRWV